MKTLTSIFAVCLALLSQAGALEPAKPQLTMTVKRQLLDTDHEMRGKQGNTQHKLITLRVELVNSSSTATGESILSGNALISRAIGEREKVVMESLGTMKVPAMKPNEKLTFDLGRITLSEVEWRNRKFEESLEEWKIVCRQGETEIGKSISSERYETLAKDLEPADPKQGGGRGPTPRKLRKLGD